VVTSLQPDRAIVKQQPSDSELSVKHPAFPGPAANSRIRLLLSLLIVGHLLAIFLPPLAFQAGGPFGDSPSVALLLSPVRGYSQFMYFDRGYAFFAPDPGPSHLIQAAVTGADGQTTESLYPDLNHQWPRLNYHRHFMLAEFLNDMYQPPGPPQELIAADRPAADDWARLRERYEHVRQSIRDHLSHVNDGKDVKIRRIEHLIPTFIDYVQDPISLDDPRLYTVLMDRGPDDPLGPPEPIPPPATAEGDGNGERLNPPLTEGKSTDAAGDQPNSRQQEPATKPTNGQEAVEGATENGSELQTAPAGDAK
jgi:hypothetical protein